MEYINIVVNASDSMRMGRNTLFFPRFLRIHTFITLKNNALCEISPSSKQGRA